MISVLFILTLAASVLQAQPDTASARNNSDDQLIPVPLIDFQGMDVNQVIEVYAQLVGKTALRSSLPSGVIVLRIDMPLTRAQAIQALQGVLALDGIAVVDLPGGKFLKVVSTGQASQVGEPFNEVPNELPELGFYLNRIVPSKYAKPSQVQLIIQPFFKSPNAILPMDASGIMVLRGDAINVRRMADMINLVNAVYQVSNDSAVVRVWQGFDARVRFVASHQKTPVKNLKNATVSVK